MRTGTYYYFKYVDTDGSVSYKYLHSTCLDCITISSSLDCNSFTVSYFCFLGYIRTSPYKIPYYSLFSCRRYSTLKVAQTIARQLATDTYPGIF